MDDYNDSEAEIDDKQHAKLIENILTLNKRSQLKKPTRTEPTTNVSEFNLVKSITGKQGTIHVNDLTKVLKKRAKHVEISKKVRNTERKAKTLPKLLEKPQAQRVKRNVAYQNVKKNLDRWDSIVAKNRSAHHLPFPIPSKLKLYTTGETIKEFNARTEEEKKYPLTMQEILERRKEIAKMRAVQSYKEAKARRQSKIKSKKYHRIQRKEKIKNQIKEFEQLQQTDPEEALKKLDEIEHARAEERASLRHHSTGKWAQSKQVRAKYDKDSRQVLAQQLSISRDLKQKLQKNDDSESEDDTKATVTTAIPSDVNNPWTNPVHNSNEVTDFVESYKKFWDKMNEPVSGEVKKDTTHTTGVKTTAIELDPVDVQVGEISSSSNKSAQSLKVETSSRKPVQSCNKQKPVKTKKHKNQAQNVGTKTVHSNEKYLGTTEWEVSNLSGDENDTNTAFESVDFDDIVEKYQKKLKQKIDEKYKLIKTTANSNSTPLKSQQKSKKAKKKGNKDTNVTNTTSKDNRIHIDENISEDNENINQELHVLKSILSSSEKIVEKDESRTIKTAAVNLNTDIPDLFSVDDNEENTDQKGTITEAFEDDDIVEEFHKDKQAEIDSEKPEDIDLNLPGWGSWGGVGIIKSSKRKNKRLILKFPKEFKRRDDNKHDVFINEKSDKKIKKHLVSEVPFPFRNVKDFEASVRAPIGETFVPELAFKKMIKPTVITKMGAIIEPMSEDILID